MLLNLSRLFIIFIFFMSSIANAKSDSKTLEGKTAPHWSLKTFEGKFEHLGNYTAPENKKFKNKDGRKVVVQSFFASWCQPCIKEIGELQKIQEEFSENDIKFFLINLTDYFRNKDGATKKFKNAPNAEEFLKEKGLDKITVVNDPTGRTARSYNISDVLPRLFILDKYRTIRKEETGLCPTCLSDELVPLLDRLLEE